MNLSFKSYLKKISPAGKTVLLSGLLLSCATYNVKKGKNLREVSQSESKIDSDFQVFLVGDAGNSEEIQAQQTLNFLKNKIDSANSNSMLIFLGDNIYPLGMPKESDKDYPLAKEKMENQLAITKNFKGKTLVIPGNHDWYHGLDGLKAQEDFVKTYLNDKKSFLPKNSCPIDDINLTKDIKLIIIDSEWALVNWDKYPGINKGCDIKTRDDFYTEFKDLITKNQDKRIIVALHHPVISSGVHAGFNSAKSHLSAFNGKVPIPGVATVLTTLRSSSGASMEDINNRHYADFANRLKSIVQDKENVIFVSGHDHNLQYHADNNIRQIISGAGSKTDPATIVNKTDFSYGGSGFAVLNLRKDLSSDVEYFSTKNNELKKLTQISVIPQPQVFENNFPSSLPAKYTTTVYADKLTKKGKIYRWLWGDHYRKYYALPIEAKTKDLSDMNPGYSPFREGGGNQSNSLRLKTNDGQEFVMRGIKKSAVRFLNAQAFKKNDFGNELNNTFPERFLLDFYTTNHPFTGFAVNNMIDKLDIFHSNPELYYIPKQKSLGRYNKNYGDELYMIEERFSSDPKTLQSLDNASDIVSTSDVLKNMRKDSKYSVEQDLYIRARIFDMLIGDWDRHEDQWKWAEYKTGNKVIYKPIPRDRDQAFSTYDGAAFTFIMNIPMIRHMKSFKDEIKNVRWVNMEPYPLDLIFLKGSTEQNWSEQAKYIQTHLTDADIDVAFKNLPKEVQDETIADIQRKLKLRKDKIESSAVEYYHILQEKVPLVGTLSPDKFVIVKNGNSVDVKQYKINKDKTEELVFEKTYDGKKTKELWVYGLDDDDIYEVSGDGKSKTNIRLIGGYNHDVYNVSNGRNVKIYDFKSQKNTYETKGATKHITDDYDVNTYNWKHPKYNFFAGYPMANYNPDDGVILGLVANFTVNNFIRDRFTQKHSFSANLYTATGGFNLGYKGVFKKAIFGWDAGIDATHTTPHFARTFFGFGNETQYDKDAVDKDYNRVRISQSKFAPSISKTSWLNLKHQFQLTFENSKLQKNDDRFAVVSPDVRPEVFDHQQFGGANYTFSFKNFDNNAFPTLGLELILNAGWKANLQELERNFASFQGSMSLFHRIDKKGKFVFANSTNAMVISNNNFEFYQAAAIGGNNGMRAYRNERFAGKSYLINNAEVRWDFGRVKNNIVPVNMGILVGYDVGRVWMDREQSNKWHQGVGGGFWMNMLESFSARIDYFTGEDGGRISGGVGLSF
ncbi:metallophosphoesterase [Chryseobacterium balustinum]|uniref:Calcineurin-like phosphoesterase n=1 Tax=Chryseobacterium balustinum TaxID=246 RepID=A0AAX2IQ77_9FLAO|nr:metallophosphoesterase [Chryseobacterium balustinum]AZB30848.1 metallophosphoesterase [Chryseobacterium balustinum]SKB43264.1 Calcineurin-like phosphoesterase [Chryseobacterium balustinum]SQA91930.1 Outer membrane protein/protective antigen OMA87 [Chryseobacterium balustinum]